MRNALILDTETTGLDAASGDVAIEVGCMLYDLEQAAPIVSYASLIRHGRNPAYDVNRITLRMLEDAPEGAAVWPKVQALAERADVILAHRAEFDRAFVPASVAQAAPWVCTKFHVDWPNGKPGDHLVHLALAHGVGVISAHRALTDCDTLARLLTRVHEMLCDEAGTDPLVRLITRAMRPRVKVAAVVSYDDRDKAKAAGFAWDATARHWWREVPKDDVAALPFPTREIAP